jgi:hypothetical protein
MSGDGRGVGRGREGVTHDRARVGLLDRFARACVAAAASRWPADLSEVMAREWRAELDALRVDTALGSLTRHRRAVAFAVCLLVFPAVEAAGAAPRTWRDRAAGPGRVLTALSAVAGVTLLAGALFVVVHDANHGLARLVSPAVRTLADIGLLAAAAGAMWLIGAAAARLPLTKRPVAAAVVCAVPVGLAMYAFLLSGNRVAVMPFMGWVDLAPGVAAWVLLTAASVGAAARFVASGRRRLGTVTGVVGALVALDATAVCGSLHAARALDVAPGSAPAWFPLALLPGGAVRFGRFFADGTASFGGMRQSGPAFHASDILLGNLSAMVGPLLLCSAFLVAYATRGAGGLALAAHVPGGGRVGGRGAGAAPRGRRAARATATCAAGLAAVAVAAWASLAVHGSDPASVLARIEDNSAVFGFGFAFHLAGRVALILVIGVLVAWIAGAARAPGGSRTPDGNGLRG